MEDRESVSERERERDRKREGREKKSVKERGKKNILR